MSTLHTLDDGTAHGLSQAWSDLSLALVDEVHALASASLRSVADAAKHGLEQAQKSARRDETADGQSWSPWLVGAAIGIGITLLPRCK